MYKRIRGTLLSTIVIVSIYGCGTNISTETTEDTGIIPELTETVESNETTVTELVISPYQRVATIPGSQADIESIALKISDYVVNTDEQAVLGFPSNWVIAGANPSANETYDGNDDLIPIPVDTGTEVYTSRVIEFCNGAYATQATNTGQQRGSALPCEVAVHSDGENVYVDMLDAEAIFSIFFPNTPDPEGQLYTMALAVKSEIREMIMTALSDSTGLRESTEMLGPRFTLPSLSTIQDSDIYQVTQYHSDTNTTFSTTDAKLLAQTIIAKLGTDEMNADTYVEGLSSNSQWRSARPDPIAIPGVFVTEACSPTYAKMATRLGSEYITALPCEITAYLDRSDESNKTIAVSILNPHFMFDTMFKGAVENAVTNRGLTPEEAIQYETLAETILNDLNKIVDTAIEERGLTPIP